MAYTRVIMASVACDDAWRRKDTKSRQPRLETWRLTLFDVRAARTGEMRRFLSVSDSAAKAAAKAQRPTLGSNYAEE